MKAHHQVTGDVDAMHLDIYMLYGWVWVWVWVNVCEVALSQVSIVVLRDCQECHINRPFRDAQNRLLWKDETCPART